MPDTIKLSSDEIDELYETRCQIAAKRILPWIVKAQTVTVAAITRAFPEYQNCIWSVLKQLKVTGSVDYNEHASSPVRVTATAMRRIAVKRMGYNNNAISPRGDRTKPDAECVFGSEHLRAF